MPPHGETKQQQRVTHWINAAREGNLGLLTQLLSESPELVGAVDDEFSSTALHEAVFHGHVRVVELLLGVDPLLIHDVDAQGRTALHLAVVKNSVPIVERLLLAASPCSDLIDAVDCYGKTALDYASANKAIFFDVAQRILAEKDKFYKTSRTPALHHAVMHGNYELAVKLLKRYPKKINALSSDRTVLHVAAQLGDPKMMAMLLAAASPTLVRSISFNHETALHFAGRHPEIVAQLLAVCPDLASTPCMWGHNMLHWAVDSASVEVAAQLLDVNLELLDQADHWGRTPLLWALYHERQAFAEMFLARKPEVIHAVDVDDNTALHYVSQCAISTGFSQEFIEKLVKLNPSAMHVVDKLWGYTPFCNAFFTGMLLLSTSCNPRRRSMIL